VKLFRSIPTYVITIGKTGITALCGASRGKNQVKCQDKVKRWI